MLCTLGPARVLTHACCCLRPAPADLTWTWAPLMAARGPWALPSEPTPGDPPQPARPAAPPACIPPAACPGLLSGGPCCDSARLHPHRCPCCRLSGLNSQHLNPRTACRGGQRSFAPTAAQPLCTPAAGRLVPPAWWHGAAESAVGFQLPMVRFMRASSPPHLVFRSACCNPPSKFEPLLDGGLHTHTHRPNTDMYMTSTPEI